ncbi:MAG: hypothetical protein JW918_03615 [Anaerolineae bacterium]|nr:hypothetical protein [Anaerolineae bacterium]
MQTMPPENYNASDSRKPKAFWGFVALTFALTLAVIIGNRLSDQALAVLAGAVCGVGAAIPTSLLIIAITRRRDKPAEGWNDSQQTYPHHPQGVYPPVIVVTPSSMQQPHGWNGYPPSLTAPIQREFTIVGGAISDREAGSHERHF